MERRKFMKFLTAAPIVAAAVPVVESQASVTPTQDFLAKEASHINYMKPDVIFDASQTEVPFISYLTDTTKKILFEIERQTNTLYPVRSERKFQIITSPDICTSFVLGGFLDYAISEDEINNECNTFAGIALGRYKVYVDPYQSYPAKGVHLVAVGAGDKKRLIQVVNFDF